MEGRIRAIAFIALIIFASTLTGCEKDDDCHVLIGEQTGTLIWSDCPGFITVDN